MKKSDIKDTVGKVIEQIKQDLLKLTIEDRFQYMKFLNSVIFCRLGLEAVLNDKKDCIGYKLKDKGANDNE